MKKYMIIIICISIVCICSCNYIEESKYPMPDEISVVLEATAENSCSEEKEASEDYVKLTAYIGSSNVMSGNGDTIDALKQYKRLRVSDISEPNIARRTFTVMNKNYSGTFLRTTVVNFNTPAYVYKATDGTQITVDHNGNIIDLDVAEFFSYYVDYPDPNDLLSEESYKERATEYLSDIYGKEVALRYNIYSTTMYTNVIKVYFNANDINYGDYEVNDRIVIRLDINGNLLGYSANCVGLYNNKADLARLSEDHIIDIINSSLSENDEQIEVHSEKRLIILSDGRLACYTSFRLVDGENAGEWMSVLIPLE